MNLSALSVILVLAALTVSSADISDDLHKFTGGATKMVWAESLHPAHKDTFLERAEHRLVGISTEDGQGIRVIREERSSYRKPLITPDGGGIVYSNNVEGKCYYLNWDGSDHRLLADGLAASVIPATDGGSPWVYALSGALPYTAQPAMPSAFRFRLDSPQNREVVWETQAMSLDNFQIARDGKTFSGLFPWPFAGVGDLESGNWTQFTRGCWPSLSPAGEILWVFGGTHQTVTMFSRQPEHRWEVSLNSHPKLEGTEVYHPRWSNHPRFFALTGPYSQNAGRMAAVFGGGDQVEVFAGRFSKDLSEVEEWLQVTTNKAADFGPDIWVSDGPTANLDLAHVVEGKPAGGGMASLAEAGWIADQRELCILWDNANAQNEVLVDGRPTASRLTLKQRATYGRQFDLLPGGGEAQITPELAKHFADRCAETNEFTIELVFNSWQQSGAGIMLSLSDPKGSAPLLLMENKNALYLSTRGGLEDERPGKPINILAIEKGKPSHLILSARKGKLGIYLNGDFKGSVPTFRCDLSEWNADRLSVGGSEGSNADWHGSIEKLALYARAIDDAEIFAKAQVIKSNLAARQGTQRYRTTATLTAVSPVPSKDDLGAYRRGLVVYTYQLEPEAATLLGAEKISVQHWAVLDQVPLPGFPRKLGEVYELNLEKLEDHPELKPEWTAAAPDPLAPVFFDIYPPALLPEK